MAAYDYTCEKGHVFTEERSIHEDQKATHCPVEECGLILNRIWAATPTVFNGAGFYSSDSRTELLKPGQRVDW
jgi:predicted nucleic acid-binding Zn ribbon protein